MSPEPRKAPQRGSGTSKGAPARRPRGLGGVFLITTLLVALFVFISQSTGKSETSLYEFWRQLLNSKHTTVHIAENTVVLKYKDERGGIKDITANAKELTPEELRLIQELTARKLDTGTYKGTGTAGFLQEIEAGTTQVFQAWLVQEGARAATDGAGPGAVPEQNYFTAMIARGDQNLYVRVDPDRAGEAPIGKVVAALRERDVPIRNTSLPRSDNLKDLFVIEERDTALAYLLSTLGPWIIFIGLFWFFIIRQMRSPGGTGSVLSFGRSRATLYTKEQRTNVTFDDVAGVDEAKDEVKEIIEFLKNPTKFQRLGGRIPRGVLLVGSPGTGKTLLAKAIAGEAEVPFFSISGSDFVEMFVGVGASRVRDLFKQAKENSPCIIFLDEIDAVGRKRGSGMGGGHDEREQTLNAILVEMDGFDTDEGIILIGATNRPDVLDPALLRPGRFDRQIVIDMPDVKGREEILRVHARKVKLAPDVDLKVIARATPGFSGADLAAVINEAAILAGMKRKDQIESADLEEARDRVKWGREKRSRKMEEEDRKVTAYHEAGHALVSALLPEVDPVHKVTIVSRGMALGATMSLPERDDYHLRRRKMLGMITMMYGGRVAELVVFGEISAGAQNDIQQATRLARMMVAELGMSDSIGPVNYAAAADSSFLGREFAFGKDHSEATAELIDKEVRRIIDDCYQKAEKLLRDHRDKLDTIALNLLKHETLTGAEVMAILRGDTVEGYRSARERDAKPPVPAVEASREKRGEHVGDVGLSGAEGLAGS